MRLVRLRLQNFRQHADTDLTFERGLTGIIGPNGAGKSTILEAIAWALYGGQTLRGGNESVRFLRAPARAPVRVELLFELGGHRYRVVRGLTMAELYLDDGTAPIANSVTAVAEMVQRRIGMSRAEFFNTYFTGQKELAVMQAMSANDRGKFLSRVLGYERLRVAQEGAEGRRRELTSEIAGMRSGLPEPGALERERADAVAAHEAAQAAEAVAVREAAEAKAAFDAVAPRWTAAQAGRDARQRLETTLAALDGELVAHGEAEARLAAERAAVTAAQDALAPLLPQVAALETVRGALEAQRALAVQDARRRALAEQATGLEADVAALVEQRERLASAPALEMETAAALGARRTALEALRVEVEAQRTVWVRDRQEVESRLRALRTQYAEVRDQRDRLLGLGEAGDCPTCTRPLGTHFRDVLDLLDRQLETLEGDGNYFRSRAEQLEPAPPAVTEGEARRRTLEEEVVALEKRLAKIQAAVQQLEGVGRDLAARESRLATMRAELATLPAGYDAEAHRTLEAEHARLAEASALATRLTAQADRAPALAREAEALAARRSSIEARRTEAGDALAALRLPADDYAELQRLHEACSRALADASAAAAQRRIVREGAAAAAARAAEACEALTARLAQVEVLEADRRLHDELVRAYGDLRTDLNAALRPEVSEIASALIADLTDARYTELELDDKYRLSLLEEGVPKPVISGGEEDLAYLVLRLAISQMIADRAGQAFSLLVLDEVFGSLDDVRRQAVLALLRGLGDRFEQVIVITHIDAVRDGLDRVITVGFDPRTGSATVTASARESADLRALEADAEPAVA
jgi:exonuclease SbcC